MKKLYLLALFSLSLVTVFCQTVYTFTNAGASGITGHNQTQVNSAYSATNLNGQVTVIGSGIQDWIVPYTGEYTISAAGASGGNANTTLGGKGREITIQLNLTAGHHLRILVGQKGGESSFNNAGCFGSDPGYVGGGGGGTFVFNQTTNSLIIATGGGGGAAFGAYFGVFPGVDASNYNVTNGQNGTAEPGYSYSAGSGGNSGYGGSSGGGSSGGGYIGNGSNGYYGGIFGTSYLNGGQGGANGISSGTLISTVNGGFGGGAGASNHSCYEADGGGGGGYSGGGGSGYRIGAGGGGGNYYTGTYISNSLNTGHGKCLITRLFGVDIDQISYNCGGASTGEIIALVNGESLLTLIYGLMVQLHKRFLI
jgi:hypothetical protein